MQLAARSRAIGLAAGAARPARPQLLLARATGAAPATPSLSPAQQAHEQHPRLRRPSEDASPSASPVPKQQQPQQRRDAHPPRPQSPQAASPPPALLPVWLPRACVAAAVAVGLGALSCLLPAAAHAAAAAAASEGGSSLLQTAVSIMLHLDKHLAALIKAHGTATYGLLWAIVFCETGLVLTPFLPGDSLLFAAGAFAGMGQLDLKLLFAVFMTSAVLGDAVNYAIGARLGKWALSKQLLNPGHIAQTSKFYAKYGGKTVVLARFVPIVRTFAPFVAGIGSMEYPKFAAYNVIGALVWTVLFVGAGFFFGNLPVVQHNFTLVVLGIVAVSVLPVALEVMAARREAANGGGGGDPKAA